MSPDTQVALIALAAFFAVAVVSIVWPRLKAPVGRLNQRLGPRPRSRTSRRS